MASCCILYTTDKGYMFPTLVSAIQARKSSSRGKADVVIFCVGLDNATEDLFSPICAQQGIDLIPVMSEAIEGQSAMLARLFLNRYVPAQYSQYLYLDSDVQILSSIDSLIEADVPEGNVLAANDPMTFLLADNTAQSRDLRKHLRSVGFSHDQALNYFNSGVLRINRKGWDDIGLVAWELFRDGGGYARFPDQDALNLAALGRRLPMSLAWNFPIFMRNSNVQADIDPKIIHFMSSPKPWHGAFKPWTHESCLPYNDIVSAYPELSSFDLKMKQPERMKYHIQQRYKQLVEIVTWGWSDRRGRILNYEASLQV